jgi:hypothetical protein
VTDLDLYVDALVSGQVLGVAAGATDGEVARALGADFLDDVGKKRMRRDYGLVELYFQREGGEWRCAGITLQVHRLTEVGVDMVPAPLAARYGAFRPVVPFAAVADAVRAGGRELALRSVTADFGQFLLPGTGSHLTAARVPADDDAAEPVFSEVWSIELRRA